jgi:hypothetical protein
LSISLMFFKILERFGSDIFLIFKIGFK